MKAEFLIFGCGVWTAAIAACQTYDPTVIGSLGGSSSQVYGINNSGQVVGARPPCQAFLWDKGVIVDLGTAFGYRCSAAFGINNRGEAVGWSYDLAGNGVAFFYSAGGRINLPELMGYHGSRASAINDKGQIAGWMINRVSNTTRAVMWESSRGRIIELGTPSGGSSQAFGINNAGEVVGQFDGRAVLFRGGAMRNLGTLGGERSQAFSINDAGQVAGWAHDAGGRERPFLWQNGVMMDLGSLGGGANRALSINNNGSVVGISANGAQAARAFLWEEGIIRDLNPLLPAGSAWLLQRAVALNDAGQIIGHGSCQNEIGGFLLSPVVGEEDRPKIHTVVNSASYTDRLAPNSLVSIFGERLARGDHRASSLPLPLRLGQTEVVGCSGTPCTPFPMIYAAPTQINFLLTNRGGETLIVVRRRGLEDSAAARGQPVMVPVSFDAPAIFEIGYDCPYGVDVPGIPCVITARKSDERQVLRGAVTDLTGTLVSSSNPIQMQEVYTLWLTGLGFVNGRCSGLPPLLFSTEGPEGPKAVVFGSNGRPAVQYCGASPQFPGLYQINFFLPDTIDEILPRPLRCRDHMLEVNLRVMSSNTIAIPVLPKARELACAP